MISCLLVLLLLNCHGWGGGGGGYRVAWCGGVAHHIASASGVQKGSPQREMKTQDINILARCWNWVWLCFFHSKQHTMGAVVLFLHPRRNHVKPKRLTHKSYKITKNKDQDCYNICCRTLAVGGFSFLHYWEVWRVLSEFICALLFQSITTKLRCPIFLALPSNGD